MELEAYLRFALALVFVLALIGLLAWVARRYGFGGRPNARSGRTRRLDVVESRAIDGKRRLVLLRRDDTEHLILTGPNSELLIEHGISAPAPTDAHESPAPLLAPVAAPGGESKPQAKKGLRGPDESSAFKDEVTKSANKSKRQRTAKA